MAFTNAANGRLTEAVATVTATPVTFAAWVKPSALTANQAIVGLSHSSQTSLYYFMFLAVTTGRLSFRHGSGTLVGGANISTGVWTHVCARLNASYDASLYVNGVSDAWSSSVGTVPSVTTTEYLNRGPTFTTPFLGDVAEIGIWNANLSDGEIKSLAMGVRPLRVRPSNLKRYRPFLDNTNCIMSNTVATGVAPSASTHPRVFL